MLYFSSEPQFSVLLIDPSGISKILAGNKRHFALSTQALRPHLQRPLEYSSHHCLYKDRCLYYKKGTLSGEAVDGVFYQKKRPLSSCQALRKGQAKPPKSRPFPHFLSITLGMLSPLLDRWWTPHPRDQCCYSCSGVPWWCGFFPS